MFAGVAIAVRIQWAGVIAIFGIADFYNTVGDE